jgi:mRNA interferase RelE/StbE
MTNEEEPKNRYTVKLASKRIEKAFDSLPKNDYRKIAEEIKRLAINPCPHGVKKLSDQVHRIRIGNYRVVYSIFDKEKIILIAKVARRSESTYTDF